MAKTKQAIEKDTSQQNIPVLYDSRLQQRIPLGIEKNGQEFKVWHTLNPLSNDRYFEYMDEVELSASRIKKVSTAILDPQHILWKELVESREGYAEKPDWKEKTHQNDAVAAIAALLSVRVLDNDEFETKAQAAVYDEDDLTQIQFRVLQSGVLMTLSHSFREETKAEADEFMAIDLNVPDSNNLASAEKLSRAEKLYRLGKKLLKDSGGYADGSDIPAWHLAATTEAFFARQAARLGKFLTP